MYYTSHFQSSLILVHSFLSVSSLTSLITTTLGNESSCRWHNFRLPIVIALLELQLAILLQQIRFLRVPQFCRKDFWQQCIDKPFSEHNVHALNVLRSLLSRMVIRHSKEQTINNGDALIQLPPRNVETLFIPFGSEAERKIYDYIELRNTQRFMELRSESPTTVLGKYMGQILMMSRRIADVPNNVEWASSYRNSSCWQYHQLMMIPLLLLLLVVVVVECCYSW